MCGADLLMDNSSKHATLGGVVVIEGRTFGLTVSHPFDQKYELPVIESSNAVRFYDSSGDEESDSNLSQGKSSSEESMPAVDEMGTNENTTGSSLRRNGPAFPKSVRDGMMTPQKSILISDLSLRCMIDSQRHLGESAVKLPENRFRVVIYPPDGTTEGHSLDWALVDLSTYGYACTNEIRHPQASKALLVTGISQIPPWGKVLIATRRGVLEAVHAGSQSNSQENLALNAE